MTEQTCLAEFFKRIGGQAYEKGPTLSSLVNRYYFQEKILSYASDFHVIF